METPPASPELTPPSIIPPPPADDWLRTLYEEAWRQYTHEGTKVYTRSSVFLAIHAGFLALLAALAAPLLTLGAPLGSRAPTTVGQIAFGIALAVTGSFAMFVAFVWRRVAHASRTYFNLRWMTAYAVEAAVTNVAAYGLAHIERRWRKQTKDNAAPFKPFPPNSDLYFLELEPLPKLRGFRSLELLAGASIVLWSLLAVFGLILFILALIIGMRPDPARRAAPSKTVVVLRLKLPPGRKRSA